MKKIKWYVWGLIMDGYSLVAFFATFFHMDLAKEKLDIKYLENYELYSFLIRIVLFVVCIIGIIKAYRQIILLLQKQKETAQLNYHFSLLIIFVVLKGVFDFFTVLIWEMNTLYLEHEIQILKGLTPDLGHPAGVMTFLQAFDGFVIFVVFVIVTIVLNNRYLKLKKSILSEA